MIRFNIPESCLESLESTPEGEFCSYEDHLKIVDVYKTQVKIVAEELTHLQDCKNNCAATLDYRDTLILKVLRRSILATLVLALIAFISIAFNVIQYLS
jgi:hypothetical protein